MKIQRPLVLGGFLLLVLGGGFLIGYATRPGAWYEALAKPSFTPPNWVFPVAWTILYVCIAVAGYRVFLQERGRTFQLWGMQLALNFVWPVIFFGARQIEIAFMVIMLLLAVILAFLSVVRDGWARLLFAPYAAWVAFAAVLNGYIVSAN